MFIILSILSIYAMSSFSSTTITAAAPSTAAIVAAAACHTLANNNVSRRPIVVGVVPPPPVPIDDLTTTTATTTSTASTTPFYIHTTNNNTAINNNIMHKSSIHIQNSNNDNNDDNLKPHSASSGKKAITTGYNSGSNPFESFHLPTPIFEVMQKARNARAPVGPTTTITTGTKTATTAAATSKITCIDDLFKLNPNTATAKSGSKKANIPSSTSPTTTTAPTTTTTTTSELEPNQCFEQSENDDKDTDYIDDYQYTETQIDAERLYFQSLQAAKALLLRRLKDRLRELRDERRSIHDNKARLAALRLKRTSMGKKKKGVVHHRTSCMVDVGMHHQQDNNMEVGVGVGRHAMCVAADKECWRVSSPLSKDDTDSDMGVMGTEGKKEDAVYC